MNADNMGTGLWAVRVMVAASGIWQHREWGRAPFRRGEVLSEGQAGGWAWGQQQKPLFLAEADGFPLTVSFPSIFHAHPHRGYFCQMN